MPTSSDQLIEICQCVLFARFPENTDVLWRAAVCPSASNSCTLHNQVSVRYSFVQFYRNMHYVKTTSRANKVFTLS